MLCATISTAAVLLSALAASAFAEEGEPAVGTWDGILNQSGTQTLLAMQFADDAGIWSGRLEVGGASSPMENLRVEGTHVRFELPGRGVFDGTISNDALVGFVSNSGSRGWFTLKREERQSNDEDQVEWVSR